MKIVLINPPSFNTVASCLPKILDEGRGFTPPLGIMYIAAQIEKETNHQVEILDAQVDELTYEQLKAEIEKRKPDVVGITTMTFTLVDVIKTAKIAKEINPNIKIILGGPHVIIYPTETINIKEVDFVILGEAETVIKPLLDNINDMDALEKVKGLVFKKNGKIINTGRSDLIQNLDDLPFPARHLTNYKKYYWALSPYRPITTMFTSRGCPYQCLFCDRPQLGKNFRPISAKRVVDEMEECQKMGIQEIFIYDDTFGVDRQRVLDICSGIVKRNIKIAWNIRTRVNTVDKEVLVALKKAGCQRIHYGVEAGTQKILNVLKKGITLEMVEKAFKLTRKVGIQTAGYFMIGSPTETEKDILETIRFMKKLKADYMHITITTPYPATGLYELALKEKVLEKDYWLEFAKNPTPDFVPHLWDKEIPREKLFYLLKKAYRSFYLRPSFVLDKIIRVRSWDELSKKTKAALNLFKIEKPNIENCTACGSNKVKRVLVFRGLFVNKCKNCGLFFVEEEIKRKKQSELYNENMYDNYWNYESGFYSKHWNEFESHEKDILNDLRNEADYISKTYNKGKLLDVGCFKGHFCSFMKEKGWETVGVDISNEAIEFGKKKFSLNLFCGDLGNLKFGKDSFDIATMWGVIEHFPNPQMQIKQIYPLLKKGGTLIIKTQNQKSLLTLIAIVLYKISFGKFNSHLDFFYSREHLCRFSPKSLGRLLESEGFSIKKTTFDSAYIFKFTINKAKIHVRIAFKVLSFISRCIGKQDKFTIFAEKK